LIFVRPACPCTLFFDFEVIMSFTFLTNAAALALLMPVAALAQQARPVDPADATAPVPASVYVSAFTDYRPSPDKQASPDEIWRAANGDVGRNGLPVGPMSMPAAQQPGAVGPDRHAGHGADHDMQGR
jgi:hypothetical protein